MANGTIVNILLSYLWVEVGRAEAVQITEQCATLSM